MRNYYRYFNKKKKRSCYNCQTKLSYQSFYTINHKNLPRTAIERYWLNSSVELLCCVCFDMFKRKAEIQRVNEEIQRTEEEIPVRHCTMCDRALDFLTINDLHSRLPASFLLILWQFKSIKLYCERCYIKKWSRNEKEKCKKKKFLEDNQDYVSQRREKTENVLKRLDVEELEFLRLLKAQLGLQVPNIDKFNVDKFGFTTDEKKKNIICLGLPNCNLSSVPDSIGNLKKLKRLNLANNKLQILPRSIIGLSRSLTQLNLNNNKLYYLPRSILSLKKLKELNVAGNFLNFISRYIKSLPNLKYLDLRYNFIESIPEFIGDLSLKYLYITGNRIQSIPESIKKLEEKKFMLIK